MSTSPRSTSTPIPLNAAVIRRAPADDRPVRRFRDQSPCPPPLSEDIDSLSHFLTFGKYFGFSYEAVHRADPTYFRKLQSAIRSMVAENPSLKKSTIDPMMAYINWAKSQK